MNEIPAVIKTKGNHGTTMKIIDAHCHIYPQKIAGKAARSIADFYSIDSARLGGTDTELLETGKKAGVERFAVCSVATKAAQVKSINEFLYRESRAHPEFAPLMALHPDMSEEDIENEIDLNLARGFCGIKLHPDFQHFYLDDEKAFPIYEAASGRLPILFHTGDKRYEFSAPKRMARVAREFKRLTCVAAHFGGWSRWEEISCYKGLENVYVDTSSTLEYIGADEAERFIKFFGAEWFMYGTDYPMWTEADELERFMSLKLTDSEFEMILSGNAMRVYGIR